MWGVHVFGTLPQDTTPGHHPKTPARTPPQDTTPGHHPKTSPQAQPRTPPRPNLGHHPGHQARTTFQDSQDTPLDTPRDTPRTPFQDTTPGHHPRAPPQDTSPAHHRGTPPGAPPGHHPRTAVNLVADFRGENMVRIAWFFALRIAATFPHQNSHEIHREIRTATLHEIHREIHAIFTLLARYR